MIVTLGSCTAQAQAWAKAKLDKSPRHREWVTISYDHRKVQAFIVYPEVSHKAPVVLVVHEIFGLSDWARSMADDLAAQGYIAIVPDLLSGAGPHGGGSSDFPDVDSTIKAVFQLDPRQIMADLNATADYALRQPSANGKLAVAGFCWGGGKAFEFATLRRHLNAAFVFYGEPPVKEAMPAITAPVYGFYAQDDARISSTVPATTAAMKAAGKLYRPVIYPGAGHGFMRAGEAPDASPANKKARDAGWARLLRLLHTM
jgi:carboxymethylenebutenolidase